MRMCVCVRACICVCVCVHACMCEVFVFAGFLVCLLLGVFFGGGVWGGKHYQL